MSNIGKLIRGYVPEFGSYGDRRIEAEGIDWIVARSIRTIGRPEFATFSEPVDVIIRRWDEERQKEIDAENSEDW